MTKKKKRGKKPKRCSAFVLQRAVIEAAHSGPWNYTVHTLFLFYIGCVFMMSFLLLLYVRVIFGFLCYLVWFGQLFFGSSLYTIWLTKRFHRNPQLWITEKTCILWRKKIWLLSGVFHCRKCSCRIMKVAKLLLQSITDSLHLEMLLHL